MILTCPSCGTRYQTDRSRIVAPGCNVRCAKCLHVWFHMVSDGEIDLDPDGLESAFDDAIFANSPSEGAGKRESAFARLSAFRLPLSPAVLAGWVVLIAFNALFVTSVIAYRQTIAEAWPQASSFYAFIGLPVNVRGLDIVNVVPRQEFEEGQPVLQISGAVVNISDRTLPVPEIHVRLNDFEQRELYGWSFAIDAATLQPGEADTFIARLTNPPPETRSVDVLFNDARFAGIVRQ